MSIAISIADLIINFREALNGILPSVQTVGIPWRQGEAYDEWDDIASSAYQGLVVEVIRSTLDEKLKIEFTLPPYDLMVGEIEKYSWILVPTLNRNKVHIFHTLNTIDEPFDTVVCRVISSIHPYEDFGFETYPISKAIFQLNLRPSSEVIDTIVVCEQQIS